MKKLITILMMAFAVIVVSCSNEEITGTGKEGDIPGVDAVMNAALDSIEKEQLGGVEGLTKYYKTESYTDPDTGATADDVYTTYLNADKTIAKEAYVLKYDGKLDNEQGALVDFDNETVIETASEYDMSDISGAKVVLRNTTTEVVYKNKGYKLYKMVHTLSKLKNSTKIDGLGVWVDHEIIDGYHLMKEDGNKLYQIRVGYSGSEYTIDAEVNLDSPSEYDTYTKL